MERKDLEDLIQRLWDQGASIEIMKILEHDKQQREALALLVEAVGLLQLIHKADGGRIDFHLHNRIDELLSRHTQSEHQEAFRKACRAHPIPS